MNGFVRWPPAGFGTRRHPSRSAPHPEPAPPRPFGRSHHL